MKKKPFVSLPGLKPRMVDLKYNRYGQYRKTTYACLQPLIFVYNNIASLSLSLSLTSTRTSTSHYTSISKLTKGSQQQGTLFIVFSQINDIQSMGRHLKTWTQFILQRMAVLLDSKYTDYTTFVVSPTKNRGWDSIRDDQIRSESRTLPTAIKLAFYRSLLVLRFDGPPGKSFMIHPKTLSTTWYSKKKI